MVGTETPIEDGVSARKEGQLAPTKAGISAAWSRRCEEHAPEGFVWRICC